MSVRSQRILGLKKPAHFSVFLRAFTNQWGPENPDGYILIAVAENKLNSQAFLDKLHSSLAAPLPNWVMNYNMPSGAPTAVKVIADLMAHTFLKGFDIQTSDLVFASGVTALLDHIFFPLADAGDGAKNDVHPVSVYVKEEGDVELQLQEAAAAAAAVGTPIKAFLITNPNNPLGTIYKTETLQAMLRWTIGNGIHLVSDEIYALSVHGDAKFTSTQLVAQEMVASGELTQEGVDAHLHLLWGLSKDFGGSGLRMGVLHTRNANLKKVFGTLSAFTQTSNLLQHGIVGTLSDLDWVDHWVAENQRLMAVSYSAFAEALTEAGIPFLPATSAMFVWLDFRQWLSEPTWEGEETLWQRMCDETRVVFSTGRSCHASEPGYFRCCFAWVPTSALVEAVRRVDAMLKA